MRILLFAVYTIGNCVRKVVDIVQLSAPYIALYDFLALQAERTGHCFFCLLLPSPLSGQLSFLIEEVVLGF